MKICKIVVDATYGSMQAVGETVQTGQVIGWGPDGQPVKSPVDGRIVGLDFVPESHQFSVTIDAVVSAADRLELDQAIAASTADPDWPTGIPASGMISSGPPAKGG